MNEVAIIFCVAAVVGFIGIFISTDWTGVVVSFVMTVVCIIGALICARII